MMRANSLPSSVAKTASTRALSASEKASRSSSAQYLLERYLLLVRHVLREPLQVLVHRLNVKLIKRATGPKQAQLRLARRSLGFGFGCTAFFAARRVICCPLRVRGDDGIARGFGVSVGASAEISDKYWHVRALPIPSRQTPSDTLQEPVPGFAKGVRISARCTQALCAAPVYIALVNPRAAVRDICHWLRLISRWVCELPRGGCPTRVVRVCDSLGPRPSGSTWRPPHNTPRRPSIASAASVYIYITRLPRPPALAASATNVVPPVTCRAARFCQDGGA